MCTERECLIEQLERANCKSKNASLRMPNANMRCSKHVEIYYQKGVLGGGHDILIRLQLFCLVIPFLAAATCWKWKRAIHPHPKTQFFVENHFCRKNSQWTQLLTENFQKSPEKLYKSWYIGVELLNKFHSGWMVTYSIDAINTGSTLWKIFFRLA